MKRTSLIAVLISFAAMLTVAQDAFARGRMYHTGLGVFMQRDPIGTPLAPPMARNLSGSQFTQRDPTAQYADGMSLYQYVRGNPVVLVDPYGLKAWCTDKDAKWDAAAIAKVRECLKTEIEGMIAGGEKSDCADVAIAAVIRCAAKRKLPLRFKYYSRGAEYFDAMDDAHNSVADFETAMRRELGATNLFDNTTQVADYHNLQIGDMFIYDLRFHGQASYSGHTMPILEVKKPETDEDPWKYTVAEGHTSTTPGEGTKIDKSVFVEAEVKAKFPNPAAGDAGPGLRDYSKKNADGKGTWPLKEPGGRQWNWKQFEGAKRCPCQGGH